MKGTFFPPFDCIHQNYVHKIRQRILGETENTGRNRESEKQRIGETEADIEKER